MRFKFFVFDNWVVVIVYSSFRLVINYCYDVGVLCVWSWELELVLWVVVFCG